MIGLIPPLRALTFVAVAYASLLLAIAWLLKGPDSSLLSNVQLAFTGATGLSLLLLLILYRGWRWLWIKIPMLNTIVFPDLNGHWQIRIHWSGPGRTGVVDASAVIKQDMLRISMEVFAPDSDSETIMAKPSKDPESGRPILYYIYRVVPKRKSEGSIPSYEGAAILKFSNTERGSLAGNYFTSRQTGGYFELIRPKRTP